MLLIDYLSATWRSATMFKRLLASALILSLASCTSALVPLGHEADALPRIQAGTDSNVDSVVYQGEAAEKAKQTSKSRSSLLFLIGQRSFEESDWTPVEDQFMIGVEWTWLPAEGIFGLEVGTAGSYDQADLVVSSTVFTFTGSTWEVYLGPRLETALGNSPVRIYAGLGPSLISAFYEGEVSGFALNDSDTSFGFYLHAGALLELGSFNVGLDLRTLTGTSISLFNFDMDADYTQLAVVAGFRF